MPVSTHQRLTPSVSLPTALITWVPIGFGIVLGTLARVAASLFGGGDAAVAAGSALCAGLGATLAVLWLYGSKKRLGWWGVVKISVTWLMFSVGLRALWLGVIVGGGWETVIADYRVWDGQPGVIGLALIAVAPLVMELKLPKTSPRDERQVP